MDEFPTLFPDPPTISTTTVECSTSCAILMEGIFPVITDSLGYGGGFNPRLYCVLVLPPPMGCCHVN